jgi:hypothetical protein
MGRNRSRFKETDVRRAVKAVGDAGQPIRGVRFHPDGGFTVMTGEPIKLEGECDVMDNPWDEVLDGPAKVRSSVG